MICTEKKKTPSEINDSSAITSDDLLVEPPVLDLSSPVFRKKQNHHRLSSRCPPRVRIPFSAAVSEIPIFLLLSTPLLPARAEQQKNVHLAVFVVVYSRLFLYSSISSIKTTSGKEEPKSIERERPGHIPGTQSTEERRTSLRPRDCGRREDCLCLRLFEFTLVSWSAMERYRWPY